MYLPTLCSGVVGYLLEARLQWSAQLLLSGWADFDGLDLPSGVCHFETNRTSSSTETDHVIRLSKRGASQPLMNHPPLPKDFEPSPPSCHGLDYLDISSAPSDMRYNQDSNTSSLTIESQPPPPVISFPAPLLNSTTTGYTPDANPFHYNPNQIYSGGLADVRRLGSRYVTHPAPQLAQLHIRSCLQAPLAHHASNSTSSTSMQTHRNTALPTPNPYNVRDVYSTRTPAFPRDYTQRSPPFPLPRRHPLSPTPSPSIGYTSSIRMDASSHFGGKGQQNIPPLQPLTTHGQLVYATGHSPIKIDIHGTIDKGFFLSDNDWTCYRRNYFSCVCSYSLTPNYPGAQMHYTPNSSSTSYDVFGFAMSLSAVVADSDSHQIELVQHTPKRDKGPTMRPERMQMSPKPPQQSVHPLGLGYPDNHPYPPQGGYPTEHTFERIQFKQATANNGKRRAAQQYYHLLVELYAHVNEAGRTSGDQWMRIAHRKSAKMIVRGRSPGHYQSERRGSSSSGPGGGSGTLGSYGGSSVLGDYSAGGSMLGGGGTSYATGGYDHRTSHYGSQRHHELPMEPMMSAAEEVKAIDSSKDYQYYPTPIYEAAVGADPEQQRVHMFTHPSRHDHDNVMTSMAGSELPLSSRVKHESESLPSLFYQSPGYYRGSCNRYDGKPTSAGYYPTMLPQSS